MELIIRNYWWPGVTRDMSKYVEECDLCQRMKNRIKEVVGKLKLSEMLEKPQTYLTVDFITKLLLVAGKDAILVVCNRLSKITYFVATMERISAKILARLFRNNVWKLHELPESVVSDRSPQFVAELTKKLNKMLGIEMRLSTVFYLQADGQIKQINQELKQYLRFFVDHRQNDWPEWLAPAEFTVNNKVHIATKVSSFIVNYGRKLRMGGNIRKREEVEKAMEFVERMKKIQKEAGVALKKTQENMKKQADRRRKKTKDQKKRDRVMLSTKNLVFKE